MVVQAKKKPAARKKAKPAAPPPRARVPNAERSALTRAKLLNAAIECLHEIGYDKTSTVLVTERARVSRGAMLHHFPTKTDLMLATGEHITQRRSAAYRETFENIRGDREKFLHLIDLMWEWYQTPDGVARIEILLGSRADAELGPRYRKLDGKREQRHKDYVVEMLKRLGVRDDEKVRGFVQLYTAALRGLRMDGLQPGAEADNAAAVKLLKDMQVRMLDDMLTAKAS